MADQQVFLDWNGPPLFREGGLWTGTLPTEGGEVELIVEGFERPDERVLRALKAFIPVADDKLEEAWRKLPWRWLYFAIRVAPNPDGRIGVQFRNYLTGSQPLVMLD